MVMCFVAQCYGLWVRVECERAVKVIFFPVWRTQLEASEFTVMHIKMVKIYFYCRRCCCCFVAISDLWPRWEYLSCHGHSTRLKWGHSVVRINVLRIDVSVAKIEFSFSRKRTKTKNRGKTKKFHCRWWRDGQADSDGRRTPLAMRTVASERNPLHFCHMNNNYTNFVVLRCVLPAKAIKNNLSVWLCVRQTSTAWAHQTTFILIFSFCCFLTHFPMNLCYAFAEMSPTDDRMKRN